MTLLLENTGTATSFALFRHQPTDREFERNERGNAVISDFAVFRSGTFRDSMGDQHTWSADHMAQMVSNFNLLRETGRFQDVPVRDGHPSFFDGGAPGNGPGRIVGYVTDLRLGEKNVDGEQMLVADFEFTEEDAAEKFRTGTFRARSSEIGAYTTNEEEMHWPVFLGFAFVDIGAVEKLFGKGFLETVQFSQHNEDEMGTKKNDGGDDDVIDLSGDSGDDASDTTVVVTEPQTTNHAAAAAATGTFMFRVNGQPTTDFAAVQQHIEVLEGLNRDYIQKTRNDFVTSLAERDVIPATQVDDMQELVIGMTPDQFGKFSKMYENAGPLAVLDNHADGTTNNEGEKGTTDDPGASNGTLEGEELLQARVDYARKSGLTEAQVQELASYKELAALRAAKSK